MLTEEWKIEGNKIEELKHTLFATLLSCVKGDAKTDVVCGRVEGVIHTYRTLYLKGLKKNEVNIIKKRVLVMAPESASKIGEVRGKIGSGRNTSDPSERSTTPPP